MPGLALLLPSCAAMRASVRSRPKPCPALVCDRLCCVCVDAALCVSLSCSSVLAGFACLLVFLFLWDRRYVVVSRAAPPPRSPSARPACPAAICMVCDMLFSCRSRCCVGYNRGGSRIGRSVVLLSVAVALSTTHPITPHHILRTAHTSRKPHTPPAPPRHSHLTRRAPHTHCIYHTLTKPDITPPTPRTSHTHHIHTTPHPFIARHIHHAPHPPH